MGLGDDVKQIATDVGGQLAGVAVDTVKAAAKTPLDVLEEILGGKPSAGDNKPGGGNEALEHVEQGAGGGDQAAQQAAVQHQTQEDSQQQAIKLQHHRSAMSQWQQHYDQGKAQEEQKKKVEQQQKEEQKKFEIKQLEKQKKTNYQVEMAKAAANAEKSRNLGAG
ncbi:MAG TPA: hypothetical protein VJ246_03700 [Patescibacteria group bacterium]|nr:hypothetical protein [Patescibacteria group bacterium]